MSNDNELLRRYVEENSEEAFAELTARHINLVYSAALRQLSGNSHLAEEVCQAVFIDLARKARSLLKHTSITAWMFTTTRFIAMNSRRTEARRQARERAAELLPESESAWQELSPVLDEAMHDLAETDREALLLRFFEGHAFAEIAGRWKITDNAARMRVERALEKLRRALEKRRVLATAAGLSALIASKAVIAAPADLSRRITAGISGITPAYFRAIMPRLAPKFAVAVSLLFVTTMFFWLESGRQEKTQPLEPPKSQGSVSSAPFSSMSGDSTETLPTSDLLASETESAPESARWSTSPRLTRKRISRCLPCSSRL